MAWGSHICDPVGADQGISEYAFVLLPLNPPHPRFLASSVGTYSSGITPGRVVMKHTTHAHIAKSRTLA